MCLLSTYYVVGTFVDNGATALESPHRASLLMDEGMDGVEKEIRKQINCVPGTVLGTEDMAVKL